MFSSTNGCLCSDIVLDLLLRASCFWFFFWLCDFSCFSCVFVLFWLFLAFLMLFFASGCFGVFIWFASFLLFVTFVAVWLFKPKIWLKRNCTSQVLLINARCSNVVNLIECNPDEGSLNFKHRIKSTNKNLKIKQHIKIIEQITHIECGCVVFFFSLFGLLCFSYSCCFVLALSPLMCFSSLRCFCGFCTFFCITWHCVCSVGGGAAPSSPPAPQKLTCPNGANTSRPRHGPGTSRLRG